MIAILKPKIDSIIKFEDKVDVISLISNSIQDQDICIDYKNIKKNNGPLLKVNNHNGELLVVHPGEYLGICDGTPICIYTEEQIKESYESPITGFSFSSALELLKLGFKVSRKGWNGKGMFLWLKPECKITTEMCHDPYLKDLVKDNGGEVLGLGTICMYTHDSTGRKAILTGWLASQSDMLSNDWVVVEPEVKENPENKD